MWFLFVFAVGLAVAQHDAPKKAFMFASKDGGLDNYHCLTRSKPGDVGCLNAHMHDMSVCYSLVTQSDSAVSRRFNPSSANMSEWPSIQIRDVLQSYNHQDLNFETHFQNDFTLGNDSAALQDLPPLILAWYCQSYLQSDPHLRRSSEFFIYNSTNQRCYFANALPEIPAPYASTQFIAGPQHCESVVVSRQLNEEPSEDAPSTTASPSEATKYTAAPEEEAVQLTTAAAGSDSVGGAHHTPTTQEELPPTGLPTTVAVGAAFGGLAAAGALGVGGYFAYTKSRSKKADPVSDLEMETNHFEVHPTASFFM